MSTGLRMLPLPLAFEPLPLELDPDGAIAARFARILASWEWTRYLPGCQAKGATGGVDCVRFVAGVLDELYGFARVPIDRLPQDIALHRPKGARAAMRKILRIYSPHERVTGIAVQPADILVVGEPRGGPGHAMIVGPRRNTLWHATPIGVHYTGFGQYAGRAVVHEVYRMRDRARWALAPSSVAEVT